MTSRIDVQIISDTEVENAVEVKVSDQTTRLSSIEHNGQIFAVLTWIANRELGLKKPEWVVPINVVAHSDLRENSSIVRWSLAKPLPPSVFDGSASRQVRRQFGVIAGPSLTFRLKH
jgi:hypothetical protein